jgi:hypothetical protein
MFVLSIMTFHVIPVDKNGLAYKNLLLPFIIWVIVLLLFVAGYSLQKKKYVSNLVIIICVLIASIDSLRFAMKWMPFDPKQLVFLDIPVINVIKKEIGYGRVYGNLGTEVSSYYSLATLEGYDPLYIKRYGEFIQYAIKGSMIDAERSVTKLNRRGVYTDRVLDLLGVTLIFHPLPDTYQGWAYPVWENSKKYTQIYTDNKFQVYRNNTELPRAKLFYAYDVKKDDKEILGQFFSKDFDFRNTLVLEKKPSQKKFINDKKGKAIIQSYTPNKVIIKTSTKTAAILFLSDTFYAQWKAFINGKEKEILRANYAFRALEVPAGENVVVFEYKEFL